MTANSKSMILLAVTLVVGFALGLFADATLVRGRRGDIARLRRPMGFVDHMETVIQPHSSAQRDSLRPLLERAAQQNQQMARDANLRLRAGMDSLRVALAPMLDSLQRDRLAAELARAPAGFMPGGRGGRGRGRGGPPGGPGFGRGGPPDGPPGGSPPN